MASVAHWILRLRLEVLAILLCGLVALSIGANETPLINWDEATYAEVAHEAVHHANYLNLTWNGEAYLKKPPLLFWMVAASFRSFGETAWSARLPSILAGVGTMLLLYCCALPVVGRVGATLAALLPLGFYFFLARGGRECATDGPLIFFSTLAIFALTRARTRRQWIPMVGAAIGLAILSKGLAGLVPLAVATLTVLIVPGFGGIGLAGLGMIVAVAGIVVAPWLIYELGANGSQFWEIFLKQETLFRVASHREIQRQAAAATLPTFLREIGYLWVIVLPLGATALAMLKQGTRRTLRRLPPALMVWTLWLILALAAACAVRTKLGWYVLPALMPTALIVGAIFGHALRGNLTSRACAAGALILLAVEMPGHWRQINQAFHGERERSRPSYVLGVRARRLAQLRGDRELFFVGVELPTMVYYSGMRTHFVTMPSDYLPDLAYHQLVLRDADGSFTTVGNFDDEWNVHAPRELRGNTVGGGGACMVAEENPLEDDLRLSLLDHPD